MQQLCEWPGPPVRSRPSAPLEEAEAGSRIPDIRVALRLPAVLQAMATQLVIALLAFTSLSVASEPDCKELVKPLVLDSHSPVSIWVHVLGGTCREVVC